MPPPTNPKIYHIVHVDRLPAILETGYLLSDARMVKLESRGTGIGMHKIKSRRLHRLTLASYPDLHVGECVPFYFCPRSIMLYVIHQANHPELTYHDGQEPIVHLEADLREAVAWAEDNARRWAFTLSNAGTYYFEDRADISLLGEIDWEAVQATDWRQHKEGKQAEFLVEESFPWQLVSRIGVRSQRIYEKVRRTLRASDHAWSLAIIPKWYY